MTLSVVLPVEDFDPNLVFSLLFKFENFSISIQRGALETWTPCFLSALSTLVARIFRPS